VLDAAEGDVVVPVSAGAAGAIMEIVGGGRPVGGATGGGGMGAVKALLADAGKFVKEEAIAVEGSLATETLASLVVELEDAVEIEYDPNLTVIAAAAAVAVAVPDNLTVTAVAQ